MNPTKKYLLAAIEGASWSRDRETERTLSRVSREVGARIVVPPPGEMEVGEYPCATHSLAFTHDGATSWLFSNEAVQFLCLEALAAINSAEKKVARKEQEAEEAEAKWTDGKTKAAERLDRVHRIFAEQVRGQAEALTDAAEQGDTEDARSALGDLQRTVLLMGKVLDAIGGEK